jgi:hypothetical protein
LVLEISPSATRTNTLFSSSFEFECVLTFFSPGELKDSGGYKELHLRCSCGCD